MVQSSDDAMKREFKRLQGENKKLKDTTMIRREVSGSILRNHFKILLNKLGPMWELYNGYKPLALKHKKIYKKLTKERDEWVEDVDIQEANRLIHDYKVFTKEFNKKFKIF